MYGPTQELKARNKMQPPWRVVDAPLLAANQSDKTLAARCLDRCKSRGTNGVPVAAQIFDSLWSVTTKSDNHLKLPPADFKKKDLVPSAKGKTRSLMLGHSTSQQSDISWAAAVA